MPGVGFGIEPAGRGPRGLRADQPPPSQSDDLHAIRQRYCGPKTLNPQVFSFAANSGQRFDLTGTPVNTIILTITSGAVAGYFADNSSQFGKTATGAHFVASATIDQNTQVIPLPPATDYIITLQESAGSTAAGCITFLYQ